MFSFLSSYSNARNEAKLLKSQAKLMRGKAKAITAHAYSQSAVIQDTAKKNQLIEAENLMRHRENQRAAIGKVRAERAGSGFTSEGTGGQAETNTREMLNRFIADRAMSASIAMSNAWQSATDVMQEGKVQTAAANAQADQYDMQAKGIRKAANYSLFAGILGSALGAFQGYANAQSYNHSLTASADAALTNAYDRGEITFEEMQQGLQGNALFYAENKVDPWKQSILSASHAGGSLYHGTAAFSPFIASYSSEVNNRKNNWGGFLSVLTGNVPYKVPAAGTIFSQFI